MMFHFLALAFSMVMPPDAPVGEAVGQVAPAAPAGARYCLRVEPITGSRIVKDGPSSTSTSIRNGPRKAFGYSPKPYYGLSARQR